MKNVFGEHDGEVLLLQELTSAADIPTADKRKLHPKSDGWYDVDDAGVEHKIITNPSPLITTGRVVWLDDVYGDDSTGLREHRDKPFKTITAALAAALSGDTVLVFPGSYSAPSGVTIPSGVAVRGVSLLGFTIQALLVTADTTLVTMGENTRLEDVAIKLTSAEHHTLKGVAFPGTTSATAKLRTATVTVDNSGAGAGNSEVYGIHSYGTGTPSQAVSAIRATTVRVLSTGGGKKRCVLVDTAAHNFYMRDVNAEATGGTDSIGGEVNFAGALFGWSSDFCSGDTADVSQTAGTLQLTAVDLAHSNANGKNFTANAVSVTTVWGDPGGLPANETRYLYPGIAAVSAAEQKKPFSRKAVGKRLTVRATTAPGVGKTTTVTVRKNGVDTLLTVALTGTNTSVSDTANSVSFAAGDDISMKVVTDVANATADLKGFIEEY